MTATWGTLFDRAAAYDVDREEIRTVSDDLEDESAVSENPENSENSEDSEADDD